MIQITADIAINDNEFHWDFIRSAGPGGQNVNKVATAVQLRFDVNHCRTLPDDLRARLRHFAGRRLTKDGILIIEAKRFRTQEKNRSDAIERLVKLLQRAAVPPKPRRRTKTPLQVKEKRLMKKRQHSEAKKRRRQPSNMDE